jgi:ribonuclease P protein component
MRYRPEQHLRRQGDIRAVREQGQRVDARAFTVWWRHQPLPAPDPVKLAAESPAVTPPIGRVCIAASKAVVGHAVLRNRAKRRLREIFRLHQAEVPAGCDLLVIARPAAGTWNFPELEKKFSEACARIKPPAPPTS